MNRIYFSYLLSLTLPIVSLLALVNNPASAQFPRNIILEPLETYPVDVSPPSEFLQSEIIKCGIDTDIPPGYVPVAYLYYSSCSGFNINATKYQLPYSGQIICGVRSTSVYPTPSNYVPVAYSYTSGCNTASSLLGSTNSTTIATPFSGQIICGFTPPPGYIASATRYQSSCNINNIIRDTNATLIIATTPPIPIKRPLPCGVVRVPLPDGSGFYWVGQRCIKIFD
ncbi:hypothetical protein [Nostoc sp. TCL26-01]|uniref:hypothetical protein n=1 Tax=Nostoc sp. TCL26-01 TaxID=2576904 RepID=UPI0015BBC1A5|nr:hypothetical protein [Nostoc sp. TCL26-01]QLE57352.1 hypothetical protein FD725_18595 [Nostoc sp. TCL26-01]